MVLPDVRRILTFGARLIGFLAEGDAVNGKPVVLVLMNGSALAVNWPDEHVPAIREALVSGRGRRNCDC